MNNSMQGIARNCTKEAELTGVANEQAKDARAVISQLGNAAKEIDSVLQIINEVADKTHLLALNASIEAASAGEAGRGFSVVANEVKELAKQSSQATELIENQIREIQHNTESAVHAIGEVSTIVEQINAISTSVALQCGAAIRSYIRYHQQYG